jgi:probable rRNA maturation factor
VQIIIVNQQKRIPVHKKKVKEIVLKTLKILKVKLTGELSVLYTDNRTIQQLNYRFLGRKEPTDVLCFNLSDREDIFADIVISTEKAQENSRLFKTSPSWEARLYLIHGILHLLGYTDRTAKERNRMHRKALHILRKLKNEQVS